MAAKHGNLSINSENFLPIIKKWLYTDKDIFIRDIVCSGAARAMYFNGIPEKNIENIVVENCEIVSEKGADLRYSDGVVLRNVRISQSEGAGYSVANCRNVTMEDCSDASGEETPDVFRYNSQNLTIK